MCMSGGGGSSGGKRLRTGQLATTQRGVSTSRVAGYDLQKKGWSAPVTTTATSILSKPTKAEADAANRARMSNPFAKRVPTAYEAASAALNPKSIGGGFTGVSKRIGVGEKVLINPSKPKATGGFYVPEPKPKVGEVRNDVRKYAYKNADGTIGMDTITTSRTYKEAEWKAKMEKNALNQTQVNDGAQARIKSRGARRGVANVQQNSRFSSKRPKTGSLRIDTSGAQVSG